MKESLLIGNMALDLEDSEAEPSSPVRIVSPTEENTTDDYLHLDDVEFEEDEEMQVSAENRININAENDCNSLEDSFSEKMLNAADNVLDPRQTSAYEDFMMHLDQQLNKIQEELETFLRVSNLLLESKERPEYSKVQHATEILDGVHLLRER